MNFIYAFAPAAKYQSPNKKDFIITSFIRIMEIVLLFHLYKQKNWMTEHSFISIFLIVFFLSGPRNPKVRKLFFYFLFFFALP